MLRIEHLYPGIKDHNCVVQCPECAKRQKLAECNTVATVKRTVYRCANGCTDLLTIFKKFSGLRLKAPVGIVFEHSVA